MLLDAYNLTSKPKIFIINYTQYLTTKNGYKYPSLYTATLLTNVC
jgi:hypothetical protein